ncbi:MAG: UvrD-helicase domain-containing protein [Chloroflexi bacterium]|nr:UvrD-helicase domain-containing protein [Chloroflexota bacterium]
MSEDRDRFRREYGDVRRAIREDLGSTLFVEAGAGTGKTSALVDRVIALVLAGTPVERIVAITFTEKAAAELKDRIRVALEGSLADASTRDAAEAALHALDRAQISTIHAFGLSLMKSFAAETATDPSFTVQDTMLAERRFEEQWRLYLSTLHEDEAARAAIDRVLGLGLTTRNLQTLAEELARLPGLAADLRQRPPAEAEVAWPDLMQIAESLAALPLDNAPPGDKLRARAETLLHLVTRLAVADEGDREALLASGAGELEKGVGTTGSKQVWGPRIDALRDAVDEARTALNRTLTGCRAQALADVLRYVVRFVDDDVRNRRREGTLVFDDLILGPRDVLRTEDVRRSLRERFDVLLIDEFQDTDPLQVEIATAFGKNPETGRIDAGRLFLVGDPKQSIYRFRRADMVVYARTKALVEAAGERTLSLALNQRSRPEVVDWVNGVFEPVMGDGSAPEVQPAYAAIHAERATPLHGPGVATMGGPVDEPARVMRQREASAIAAQCAEARGSWAVEDRATREVRPAAYRDIAILLPTRVGLAPLERALQRAGIPYRIEGGSLIYQTQEVRDLINCLAAIDDPADDVAIVAALRSGAFACSDVELARYRLAGGRFNYLGRDASEGDGAIAEALRTLRRYHESRHAASFAALVERFVAERGQDEVGLLVQSNRDSFRRMRFVVEQARKFEAAGPESLRSFVTWMERRAGSAALDHEGTGLDDDEDAVRILTVHGAKGLEFPIVFVAGLSWAPSNLLPVFTTDRTDGSVAVRIGAKTRHNLCEAGDVARLHAIEKAHVEAEFARVLYVAATRARDHLVVSLYHSSKRGGKSAAKLLIDNGARDLAAELAELPAVEDAPATPFADLRVDAAGPAATFDADRAALVDQRKTQRYASATSLGKGALDKDEPTDETEPW